MIITWITYALLCAFFQALNDLFTKKYAEQLSDRLLVLARIIFAVPVLWLLCLIEGLPPVDGKILITYAVAAPLDLAGSLLYVRALRLSPLSLTVPFLSFTPAFLVGTSFLLLQEQPGLSGIAGILLIVAGSYALNLSARDKGLLHPFRVIFREKGSLLMLVVAFIYSITSNLGKMGVLYSSPVFFGASYYTILSALLLPFTLRRIPLGRLFNPGLLYIGACSSLMIFFHFTALKLALVSYMVAVKRTSLLFGIIFGALIFGEKGFREKITGGLLMVAGIILIALRG